MKTQPEINTGAVKDTVVNSESKYIKYLWKDESGYATVS